MKKMLSLFIREYTENNEFMSIDQVTPGCEWVANNEGFATQKHDGTCCLIMNGEIYKRFDAKPGRHVPDGAIPCQDLPDKTTGHWPHWVKCDRNNPSDKWHIAAFAAMPEKYDGTYELCGIHFQNNIDKICDNGDIFIPHGCTFLNVSDRSFEGIKKYLSENYIEGIVFHHPNGDMCKVKRSDFGLPWGNSKR